MLKKLHIGDSRFFNPSSLYFGEHRFKNFREIHYGKIYTMTILNLKSNTYKKRGQGTKYYRIVNVLRDPEASPFLRINEK